MKILSLVLAFALLFTGMAVGTVAADDATASEVMVTNVTIDPSILMRGDIGTITVKIVNNAASSVAIRSAKLYGNEVRTLADPYQTVSQIGPGNTMTFTFTVQANAPDGIYYPVFVLDYRDAGQLRHPIPVQVESSELQLAIVGKPNDITLGRSGDYRLLIGNPRDAEVNGVLVVPEGTGFDVTPSSAFVGRLAADGSSTVSFNITPSVAGNVTFVARYKTGTNNHQTTLVLPLATGQDRKRAEPVLTNLQVTQTGGIYHVTGDVTNAGLDAAKSVVITSEMPAVPTDPYKVYVVGSLDPDDFSSFEISFKASDTTSAPVLVNYKDDEGNAYQSRFSVDFANQPSSQGQEAQSLPIVAIVAVALLVVAIAGIIVYSWRRA